MDRDKKGRNTMATEKEPAKDIHKKENNTIEKAAADKKKVKSNAAKNAQKKNADTAEDEKRNFKRSL